LWNGSEEKECKKCGEVLTWDNFTIDHIKPYSKGGRTSLDNAQLMCRSCNSRKGAN
jgi:5-methylcytosine-specific restriction endonuclease McrA